MTIPKAYGMIPPGSLVKVEIGTIWMICADGVLRGTYGAYSSKSPSWIIPWWKFIKLHVYGV